MDSKTFVNRLARQLDCDASVASFMIDSFSRVISERGAELDTIALPGFGNFVAMKCPETIETDPETGKRMLMPPKIIVEFVAGTKLNRILTHE